jgi:hypothetical protein
MKVPFYQSQWFNVDLAGLAHSLGHSISDVADGRLYAEVYKKLLSEDNKGPSAEWIAKKHRLSDWLCGYFKNKGLEKTSILSIGCGLGVVEQPLIKQGFLIDLQECQSISIDYFKEKYPEDYKNIKLILSDVLKSVKDHFYDTVMAITSTYGLDDSTLTDFFESVSRVIKKGGTFLLYETVLTFSDIKNEFKKVMLNRGTDGLLWGWKRSRNEFVNRAKKNGLSVADDYYFDNNNHLVKFNNLFERYLNFNSTWGMLVFKKL